MLYDRPYMRQDSAPAAPKTSMVTRLLIITIAIAVVVQLVAIAFPATHAYSGVPIWDFINNQLALSGSNFKELKIWTLLSYGFFHAPQTGSMFFIPIPHIHLVINMLMLFILGRHVEQVLGSKRFLALYLGGIVAGGVLYAVLHFNGNGVAIGASAAVSALFGFFALINPNAQMILIPIPIPIRVKWLLYGYLAITLFGLANEISQNAAYDRIAHSAHLGGLLFGLAFHRYVYQNNAIPFLNPNTVNSRRTTTAEPPAWFKRRAKQSQNLGYSVNRSSREELQAEVDRILDKINSKGFGSLSDAEKETLDRAKEILNK